jgi:hypothetical protein
VGSWGYKRSFNFTQLAAAVNFGHPADLRQRRGRSRECRSRSRGVIKGVDGANKEAGRHKGNKGAKVVEKIVCNADAAPTLQWRTTISNATEICVTCNVVRSLPRRCSPTTSPIHIHHPLPHLPNRPPPCRVPPSPSSAPSNAQFGSSTW